MAKTRHMSMESVCEAFDIAAERGIAWADVKDAPEDEVYRLFCPNRHARESAFDEPDWDYVHKEMAKVGVNPRLLHDEYKVDCARRYLVAMGHTRFCERYGDHVVANNFTKRIEHKAGVSCEVDWSSSAVGKGLVDATAGEVSRIYLFELIERRYMSKSTVLCTQYTPAEWHVRLGGGVQVDAMVGRLVHGSVRIDLGDVNARKLLAEGR